MFALFLVQDMLRDSSFPLMYKHYSLVS